MDEELEKEEIVLCEWLYDPCMEEWNYYFSDGSDRHWRITCWPDVWSLSDYCMWNARIIELNDDWDDIYT